jgi:glycosyltransferase involved in cell wall biosynthesis
LHNARHSAGIGGTSRLGEDDEAVSSAMDDLADPVAKIGDLAASAGVRRIHVLAWRDLADVEAGGSEAHIAEVAKLWAAAGVEVTMRTSWAQGQPVEDTRDGYRVIRRAGRYMVFPRAAAAELFGRTGPRDCLVEIWNGMPFLSPLWNVGPRVTFLHHVHGSMWDMTLGPKLGKVGQFVEAKMAPPFYKRAPVVTLSHSSKAELVDRLGFPDDVVTVVPPGIDNRFTPGDVAKSPDPLIMTVCRLAPVKRVDLLVRAAHAARNRVPNLKLHIVGDGYERPRIKAVIDELDANDWVTMRGYMTDDELVDLMRQAWVVASASAHEGWGMTLTEAAACGTPAVASRIAGHADAVVDGSSGLLAEPGPEFADALARVLGDEALRRKLTDGALAHARTLTWSATSTELMRIIAAEVSRRRTRR